MSKAVKRQPPKEGKFAEAKLLDLTLGPLKKWDNKTQTFEEVKGKYQLEWSFEYLDPPWKVYVHTQTNYIPEKENEFNPVNKFGQIINAFEVADEIKDLLPGVIVDSQEEVDTIRDVIGDKTLEMKCKHILKDKDGITKTYLRPVEGGFRVCKSKSPF
ncbi:MAG: hypothetical protein HY094_00420 [Candidatus Melainabacteria bacterium]|nr:hypothetical protein [Candidatus Melainabacteria bacterium]